MSEPRRLRSEAAEGGFALFEVLVATAITGIALAVIYGLLADSLRSSAVDRSAVEASLVARSILAEVAAGGWPDPGEYWSPDDTSQRWRLRLRSSGEGQLGTAGQVLIMDLSVWSNGVERPPMEFKADVYVAATPSY